MVIDTLQPRRGRREEEMVVTTLPFPMSIPVDNEMVVTMLPFPMLIPVDNDLKSLALSVDVISKTLVALESAFLIGGDTAQTVDVSDLPQKTEGGVTGRTETASRSPSTTRL